MFEELTRSVETSEDAEPNEEMAYEDGRRWVGIEEQLNHWKDSYVSEELDHHEKFLLM